MATRTYKVVTGSREVEFVEADSVTLDPSSSRLNFSLEGSPVASYIGYTSFAIYTNPAPVE